MDYTILLELVYPINHEEKIIALTPYTTHTKPRLKEGWEWATGYFLFGDNDFEDYKVHIADGYHPPSIKTYDPDDLSTPLS